MEKIYIAVAFGGSYEDAWESNHVASLDQSKIVRYVEEQNARIARLKDVEGQLFTFTVEYDKKNPFDRSQMEAQQEVPKWPSGIDQRLITKEMRAERDSIRAFNAEVIARNHQRMMKYNEERNEAMLGFLISIGFDFKDLPNSESAEGLTHVASKFHHATDVSYRVDEVDLL